MQLRALLLVLVPAVALADEPPAGEVSADVLFYSDSDRVIVVTPQVSGTMPVGATGGIEAGVMVDVLTAASVDVISNATESFDETRVAGRLGGSLLQGGWRVGGEASVSYEGDYLSRAVGVFTRRRLAGADAVMNLRADLAFDRVGRTGTPSDVFSEDLQSYALSASLTQIVTPALVVRLTAEERVQTGYLAKPYRFVPLFSPEGLDAAGAEGGLDLDNFERFTMSERPAEHVPDLRWRQTLAARAAYWLASPGLALRADYRFYADSWALFAHTLELGVVWPLGPVTLSLAERVHRQDAASFYEEAYVVRDGQLPEYRTLDRELAGQLGSTTRAGVELSLGDFRAYVDAGWMIQRFEGYFLLDQREALMITTGLRWTP
jgi:hypothetical protein